MSLSFGDLSETLKDHVRALQGARCGADGCAMRNAGGCC